MARHPFTLVALAVLTAPAALASQTTPPCAQHARDCPAPKVIEVSPYGTQLPPSDAIVLFDGSNLFQWRGTDGGAARWKIGKGFLEVVPGTGAIRTAQGFGDVQLHVEWASPTPPEGRDQNRGNSGVFLMERYEVQVLDSYANVTYPDGQAAAAYGQYPPLVDASRGPGEWQSYDIVFHRPRFDSTGAMQSPARLTVFHNGVLVHDNVSLTGPTGHQRRPPYQAHTDKLPISLQDHQHPVRYRNIWVRELER